MREIRGFELTMDELEEAVRHWLNDGADPGEAPAGDGSLIDARMLHPSGSGATVKLEGTIRFTFGQRAENGSRGGVSTPADLVGSDVEKPAPPRCSHQAVVAMPDGVERGPYQCLLEPGHPYCCLFEIPASLRPYTVASSARMFTVRTVDA